MPTLTIEQDKIGTSVLLKNQYGITHIGRVADIDNGCLLITYWTLAGLESVWVAN
jgi:hypothetical protein